MNKPPIINLTGIALRIQHLLNFCEISRPIMLKYMTINSCIGATRVACDCLQELGFDVRAKPTKLAITIPSLEIAYTSGLTHAELAQARDRKQAFESGWNGHLVTIVNNTHLLDLSLDQASAAIPKLELPHKGFLFPLPDAPPSEFSVEYKATLENNLDVTIKYVSTNDESYRNTDAWNDAGLPFIVTEILDKLSSPKTRG